MLNSGKLLILLMRLFVGCIVLVFPAILIYLLVFVFYSEKDLALQNAESLPVNEQSCNAQQKLGALGEATIKTAKGFRYHLKTPLNYSSDYAWPMLVVFSPVLDGKFMEAYTGLTSTITKQGFVIAYVDSVTISLKIIPQLTEIINDINERWCIDAQHIFVAGHSDGATIAQALHFLPEVKLGEIKLAGFISSAAGLQKQDLQAYACPSHAVKGFILHNINDKHFLNFGSDAATWWAECQQCDNEAVEIAEGCVLYKNCQKGGFVKFCEQPGSHLKWPERHEEIVNFLKLKN